MRRITFSKLLERVRLRIERQDTNFRKAVPASNVLLAFLYYAAHGVSFAVLHEKIGIGISTCSEILRRVAGAISELGLISLPSEIELLEISVRNERRSGIPQCTLSVDGSHIPIMQPQQSEKSTSIAKGFIAPSYMPLLMIVEYSVMSLLVDPGRLVTTAFSRTAT
ncbi:Nuclease HARBI1 [Phytophthora megakarya]|uniref:Nuclease HARBI1 n=1 Tax=Phytophthora megakarya TaxID=4795 RepID=A0A225W3B5_9STRA|nr:Nuclease HARBI1 [Phytophthora megakarya]